MSATPERLAAVDRMLTDRDVVASMSAESRARHEGVIRLLQSNTGLITELLGTETQALSSALEAVFYGWMLGLGITNQDAAERHARIQELAALFARAAENSAAHSARLERRQLQ